jgi:hypothetical protein
VAPVAAPHASVTVDPLTEAIGSPGASGGPAHGERPIVNCTSFDGPLRPFAFDARTRTKYTPLPMPDAENVVPASPVENAARLLEPDAEPASIT